MKTHVQSCVHSNPAIQPARVVRLTGRRERPRDQVNDCLNGLQRNRRGQDLQTELGEVGFFYTVEKRSMFWHRSMGSHYRDNGPEQNRRCIVDD